MKLSKTKKLAGALALSMALSVSPGTSLAATNENPSSYEINRLLTEAALKHNVPPEIVKAIAHKESAWKQFNEDGTPVYNSDNDGGIGIMQITNNYNYDTNLLKTDINYNINAGVEILKSKLTLGIPSVGNESPNILENWYFAVLAYNGEYQVNSPVNKRTNIGTRNYNTYQDAVYKVLSIANNDMFDNHRVNNISFNESDFTYKASDDYLYYNKWHYALSDEGHTTKHKFEKGDLVLSDKGASFRKVPTTYKNEPIKPLLGENEFEVVEIQDSFVYDTTFEDPNSYISQQKTWDQKIANHYVWYDVERQIKKDGPEYVASGALEYMGKRLSGDNRYETAVNISQRGWQSADTVVLAHGRGFADALAGAPLAYKLDAPLLMTETDKLDSSTKSEIKRLGAKNVVILGGTAVVSTSVANDIDKMSGVSVERIAGKNRYETAKKIADRVNPDPDKVIVADGWDFPDALSAAPYAASNGYPILLTDTDQLNSYTREALRGVKSPIVVGGDSAVSKEVFNSISGATRVYGSGRTETSVALAKKMPASEKVFIATGWNFADALAGSVLAAKENVPVLLTATEELPASVKNFINVKKYNEFYLLGGNNAVNVDQELGEMIESR